MYGAIRPYRPWRNDEDNAEPWRTPFRPPSASGIGALIYLNPPKTRPGVTQHVVIPAELQPLLRHPGPHAERAHAHPRPPPWPAARSRLAPGPGFRPWPSSRSRLCSGGWLPPSLIEHTAAARAAFSDRDFYPSRRTRFPTLSGLLHHLADCAHWLMSMPTPMGRSPLRPRAGPGEATPAERWRCLLRLAARRPQVRPSFFQFKWPGLGERPPLAGGVPAPAAGQPAAAAGRFPDQLRLHDAYGFFNWSALSHQSQSARQLCLGPLHRLQVLDLAIDPTALATPPPPEPPPADDAADFITPGAGVELLVDAPLFPPLPDRPNGPPLADLELWALDSDDLVEPPPPPTPAYWVRLTAHGAWLLGLPDWGPPPLPAPQPVQAARQPDLLRIAPTTAPHHLARLAPFCTWASPAQPQPIQQLTLDAARVGRAVAQGAALAEILQIVTNALGRPPSRRQVQRLRTWARAGQQVVIRPLLVLETATPQLMGQLRSRQLIRRHLDQPLAPTRVAVNPSALPNLLQSLATLGHYATAPTADETAAPGAPTTAAAPALPPDLLWTLLQIYQALGHHVELPVAIPYTLSEQLGRALSHDQRAAAESAAQRVITQLESALEGYLRLPPWAIDSITDTATAAPTAEILAAVEAAIAHQHDLTIVYYSATGAASTTRRITPYWL
ncbi:MAG: hypothetical protein R2911_28385, partial [Caldilineaceae bacterium]